MDLPGANQQRLLLSHFSITGLNLQYLIIYIQARHLHRQEPCMFVVLWLWMVASTLQLGLGCQRNLKAVKMHIKKGWFKTQQNGSTLNHIF